MIFSLNATRREYDEKDLNLQVMCILLMELSYLKISCFMSLCVCRSLRVLSLEDSDVIDEGGEWLHALAQNNSVLESLDFAVPGLDTASVEDLAFLVGRCKSLVSLKVGDIDMSDLAGVLSKVPFLKELGTGGFSDLGDENKSMAASINLPQHLTSLSGLWAMPDLGLQMVQPVAANLKKLDLKFTVLSCRGHCELLSHCFALEELQVCMSPLVLQSWLTKPP